MRRPLPVIALTLLFVLVVAAYWMRLPYYALGPGPAREVAPLIKVEGRATYPDTGRLVMTTISFRPLTMVTAFSAWLDPDEAVVSREILYPSGTSVSAERQRSISQMDQSKIDATVVVLRELTKYPKEHGVGALVESVAEGCPAEGELFAGDVIVAIDGDSIDSAKGASTAIAAVPAGEPIDFQVQAAGETHDVTLARARCAGIDRPVVGISSVDAFPFSVSIASGEVGGPSAGLMWALGLHDLLTPGDLTSGRLIAGTGTIDLAGSVGSIGGITDKVAAARNAGAAIFLCPQENLDEAKAADAGHMVIVPVGSFEEALTYLEG